MKKLSTYFLVGCLLSSLFESNLFAMNRNNSLVSNISAILNGSAILVNLTNLSQSNCSYPAFTLTDSQAVVMAGWQIGSGLWSVGLIVSNYFAPYYFFKREENARAENLTRHKKHLKTEVKKHKRKAEAIQGVFDAIDDWRNEQ